MDPPATRLTLYLAGIVTGIAVTGLFTAQAEQAEQHSREIACDLRPTECLTLAP